MEAVPESLKNMLLVMATSGVINPPGTAQSPTATITSKQPVELWDVTWEKVNKFLPNLKDELFPPPPPEETPPKSSSLSSLTENLSINNVGGNSDGSIVVANDDLD